MASATLDISWWVIYETEVGRQTILSRFNRPGLRPVFESDPHAGHGNVHPIDEGNRRDLAGTRNQQQ